MQFCYNGLLSCLSVVVLLISVSVQQHLARMANKASSCVLHNVLNTAGNMFSDCYRGLDSCFSSLLLSAVFQCKLISPGSSSCPVSWGWGGGGKDNEQCSLWSKESICTHTYSCTHLLALIHTHTHILTEKKSLNVSHRSYALLVLLRSISA